jgi:hypothetical protein
MCITKLNHMFNKAIATERKDYETKKKYEP